MRTIADLQPRRSAALAAGFLLTVCLAMGSATPRVPRLRSMTLTTAARRGAAPQNRPAGQPTSSLFSYRRDDSAPDGLTHIRIDVARRASAPVHPDLFGNFIEHLGGVVYPGLWAQLVLNPGLEAIEPRRSTTMAPPEWQLNRQALWRTGGKEAEGYLSPGFVTLLAAGSGEAGQLSQTIYPPVHRIRTYSGSLAIRALPEADTSPEKTPLRAQICVALAAPRGDGKPVAEAHLSASSTEWTRLNFRLAVPEGRLAPAGGALLTIANEGASAADVDRIEIFPTDAVEGADPDVIKRAIDWHIPLLRWPGGNFASGYHWQDGVGCKPGAGRAGRPTRRNEAWGGVEPNEFGTDEFLAFSARLGARPQLTVNAGDGTPEEAANWVQYCNASSSDRYGAMRAECGHSKPYGVKLWEVGNELYGDWQIGHTQAQENARRFVRFRDAMLAADPTLRLIATGKGDEFLPDGMARNSVWNEALLRASLESNGKAPDYLSIHPLVPLPGSLQRSSYSEQYESAMAHPTFLDRTLLPDLWARIESITGAGSGTRIAITEWGIIVGGSTWRQGPNHDTVAGAVYNALCLNTMLRQSDRVTLANMTAFMHGGGIKKPGGVVIVDPQYYVQQQYAAAHLHTPVAVTTTGPGRDVPQRGFLPGVRNVPDVDIFAALDSTGTRLIVCAVNRLETESRPIDLDAAGFHATHCEATLLTSASTSDRNTVRRPNAVAPRPLPVARDASGGGWRAALPPHSVAWFTLSRH